MGNLCQRQDSRHSICRNCTGTVSVPGISAMVLVQGDDTIVKAETKTETENDTTANASTERAEASGNTESAQSASGNMPLIIGGIAAAAAAAVAAGIFIKKRKK